MSKIGNVRLLIGAAALATAGTSAGFALVAATAPVGVQADPSCEGAWLNGKTVFYTCKDPGNNWGAACVPAGVDPQVGVLVCVPD